MAMASVGNVLIAEQFLFSLQRVKTQALQSAPASLVRHSRWSKYYIWNECLNSRNI